MATAPQTQTMGRDLQRSKALSLALPAALVARDQLFAVYQPIIDLATGACLRVEALLRWRHPQLGLVSPAEFIPLVERGGLMRSLTTKACELAFADLEAWSRRGHDVGASVNISASLLEVDGFVDELLTAIARCGLSPERIELELTESVPIADTPRVRAALQRLVDSGLMLALDDFGLGENGLRYLRDLPTRVLKIDRLFVRELADNPRDQIIVRAIVSMAQALGYRVTAEGVETERALELLKSWGCDAAQGYFICKPIPFADLIDWLAERENSLR